MPDDTTKPRPRKTGQRFHVHIIPPMPDPIREEDLDTRDEAEALKAELEKQGCRVTVTPVNVIDPTAPIPSVAPQVTWVPADPVDIIGGARTLGSGIGRFERFIAYRGLDPQTLLEFGTDELYLAKGASGPIAQRHAINAVHYAKMALDCLFDAYLERDYLTERLRAQAGFAEKVQLVRKRLGQYVVPDTLIAEVVADPRDTAQHERIPPTVLQVVTAIQAARTIFEATTRTADPLRGHGFIGSLGAGFNNLADGGRRPFFQNFPPAFGLLWRGRDGIARAGVGQAGVGPHDKHVAEARYAPLKDFREEQHLELLGVLDNAGTQQRHCQNEHHLRELLVLADLDGPS